MAVRSHRYFAVTAFLLAGGCGNEPPAPDSASVASVEIRAATTELVWPYLTTLQIHAVARNAGGDSLPGQAAIWESSAPSRISVAGTDSLIAEVTGRGFGTATLTAIVAGHSAEATFSYVQGVGPPFIIGILPDTSRMPLGSTRVLRLQRVNDFNRGEFILPGARWESSDPAVAETNEMTGEVRILADGHAKISAVVDAQHFTADVFGFHYAALLTFSRFSIGSAHVCGLTPGGSTFCWGLNDQGQLGSTGVMDKCHRFVTLGGLIVVHNAYRCSQAPVAVSGQMTFTSISAGGRTTCALTSSGAAYCWGRNAFGMTGTGAADTVITAPTPVQGGVSFKTIDVGEDQVCGVSIAGSAYCWGSNASGALGDGTVTDAEAPTIVAGGQSWKLVRAGHTACGITNDGAGYCWGVNTFGRAGAPEGAQTLTPTRVSTELTFTEIGSHELSCGLTGAGIVYCWGHTPGTEQTGHVPIAVVGGSFAALDARGRCAVDEQGGVFCWNAFYPYTAVRAAPTFPVRAFAVGIGPFSNSLRCAVDLEGILWCWDVSPFTEFMWWGNEGVGILGFPAPQRVAGQP